MSLGLSTAGSPAFDLSLHLTVTDIPFGAIHKPVTPSHPACLVGVGGHFLVIFLHPGLSRRLRRPWGDLRAGIHDCNRGPQVNLSETSDQREADPLFIKSWSPDSIQLTMHCEVVLSQVRMRELMPRR